MIQCARVAFGFVGIYDEDEAERIIGSGSSVDGNVVDQKHARLQVLGGEGVGACRGVGTCQRTVECRFAGVGWPEENDLTCTVGPHRRRRTGTRPSRLGARKRLGQLLDLRLDARLDVLRSFVLGDRAHHLPQELELFARLAGAFERSLGLLVLGRDVGRNGQLTLYSSQFSATFFDGCTRGGSPGIFG